MKHFKIQKSNNKYKYSLIAKSNKKLFLALCNNLKLNVYMSILKTSIAK